MSIEAAGAEALSKKWVNTIDYHTGGEPFRIVAEGVPELPGETVAERRVHAIANHGGIDNLRELLVNEPRGHADMYGGFIVPADDAGAHFGVLFWHKDGFSTACGHGTIALGVWATDTGLVESNPNGTTEVRIDVPSGRVTALVERSEGKLVRATFTNVESWPIGEVELETSRGKVTCELSYSGAIYASLPASDVGLEVTPEHYNELIAIGREIKWALNEHELAQHSDERLSGVYGTILYDRPAAASASSYAPSVVQRNITVFADGEVDRSPCGSGTGARLALLAQEQLKEGETLEHHSIVGSVFYGSWERAGAAAGGVTGGTASGGAGAGGVGVADGGAGDDGGRSGEAVEGVRRYEEIRVVPKVSGTAYLTGRSSFWLDPADELGLGFTLR